MTIGDYMLFGYKLGTSSLRKRIDRAQRFSFINQTRLLYPTVILSMRLHSMRKVIDVEKKHTWRSERDTDLLEARWILTNMHP